MSIHRIASLCVITAALAAGCGQERPLAETAGNCTGCHGGLQNASGAPPFDREGNESSPAVGAHTVHIERGLDCVACHVKPTTADAPGHIDGGPAEIVFGDRAKEDGAEPTYDFGSRTCSSTYCHGSTLQAGGVDTTPEWTGTATCGTCHGRPPPPPHPTSQACGTCHPGYGDLTVNPVMHVDGTVQTTVGTCTSCHGDPDREQAYSPAPPVAVNGATSPSDRGVGAHAQHLFSTRFWKPNPTTSCAECHPVVVDMSHVDGGRAEIVFEGPISQAGTPSYDGATTTCSSTYCHGATLAGGDFPNPVWTAEGQAFCGSCHAIVMPPPHPQEDRLNRPLAGPSQCRQCHVRTVDAAGAILIDEGRHVNGQTNVDIQPGLE